MRCLGEGLELSGRETVEKLRQLGDPALVAALEPHLIATMPDHELWMTFFRDTDRNLHGLMSEIR